MNGAAELLRVERRATDDAPAATADGLLEAARLAASAALLIWSCDTRSMSVLARWRCRCKDVVLGAVVDGASAITLQAVNQFTASPQNISCARGTTGRKTDKATKESHNNSIRLEQDSSVPGWRLLSYCLKL